MCLLKDRKRMWKLQVHVYPSISNSSRTIRRPPIYSKIRKCGLEYISMTILYRWPNNVNHYLKSWVNVRIYLWVNWSSSMKRVAKKRHNEKALDLKINDDSEPLCTCHPLELYLHDTSSMIRWFEHLVILRCTIILLNEENVAVLEG